MRSIERSWIDDANAIHAFVAGDMSVPVKNVIGFERIEAAGLGVAELTFVAMEDGEVLAVEGESHGNRSGGRQRKRVQIGQQSRIDVVHIAPNEGEGSAGQFVEHMVATDVAAMDDVLDTKTGEKLHGAADHQVLTMAVG